MSIRYRAIVRGVETERPLQLLGSDLGSLETWAVKVLKGLPSTAFVEILESKEEQLKIIRADR